MNSKSQTVIKLDQLKFRWPNQIADTIEIDELQLEAGEHLFVRGASGSGKTTLLNLLAGIHKPTNGKVELLGQNLASLSVSQRDQFRADHMGVVFQQFNLLPYLTTLENVTLSCAFSKRKQLRASESSEVITTAKNLLSGLNLSEELHKAPVSELSVGQQQRVAVARALIGRPEIVIADEPTSALDADNRDRFLDLLFQEVDAQACTLIFVSHDPQIAKRFERSIELTGKRELEGVL